MAYLGRAVDSGSISNIENLDNITFDGSSSYSLTKNSVAFVPASASNLLISIDGVVNATNFTVSGSTVDFGVAVSSSSVCNFIIHLGVGIVTAPSDSSVTTAKLASGAVNNSKIASDAAIATTKLGTGAVLQVVFNSYGSETVSTSTSIIATGLEATITPTSTSSKIFLTASQSIAKNNFSGAYGDYYIFRDSTQLIRQHRNATFTNTNNHNYITAPFTYLDSPNTTSATTYSTRFRRAGNGGQVEANTDASVSTIVLMEIAG